MPTEGEKLKIRRLVAAGQSYQQIADQLPGWTPRQCRSFAIRQGWVKETSRYDKEPPKRVKPSRKVTMCPHGEFGVQAAGLKMDYMGAQPKPGMLAERDRAYATPRSLTAIVFGDPLPGRSALDKRNAAS